LDFERVGVRLAETGAVDRMVLLGKACSQQTADLSALDGSRVLFAGCPFLEESGFYERSAVAAGLEPHEYGAFDARSTVFGLHDETKTREEALVAQIRSAATMLAHKEARHDRTVTPARKVLVIGSGLSALTAAKRLAGDIAGDQLAIDIAELPDQEIPPGCLADHLARPGAAGTLKGKVADADVVAFLSSNAIVDAEPVLGGYAVCTGEGRRETYGTVVFAPERVEGPNGQTGALSLTETFAKISSGGAFKGPVVFLLDYKVETRPEIFRDALVAALHIKTHDCAEVTVLLRSARVAMESLQELYDDCRNAEIVFLRYDEDLRIQNDFGDFVFEGTNTDTATAFRLVHPARVIIPGVPQMSEEALRLSDMLGLRRYGETYSQPDTLWRLATETNREGVFVMGSARSNMDRRGIEADAESLLLSVRRRSSGLPVVENIAVVDGDKCVYCLTCVRICPVGAMTRNTLERVAMVLEPSCVGCGLCAAECPAEAIQLRNLKSDTIAAGLAALR
jgi:heterodisulfide reductase subunit A-like polyferredoxin